MNSTPKVRKKADFKGVPVYVGLDVHLKSWSATILTEEREHKTFSQPPHVGCLVRYLRKHFPGADLMIAYEAGYSGFWIHDELREHGIDCSVLSPQDIPTKHKEKDQKNDAVDSRKIALALRGGLVEGVHVPERKQREERGLVRRRHRLRKKRNRLKSEIKHLLYFHGIAIPEELNRSYWSRPFMDWLRSQRLITEAGQADLDLLLEEFDQYVALVKKADKKIRELSRSPRYADRVGIVRSVPGIGPVIAMTFLTELEPLERFPDTDHLCSMIGFHPTSSSSGERSIQGKMTGRHNPHVREMLLEGAWKAIGKDPALELYYRELRKRMNKKRAVVRVARKLVNRIHYLLKKGENYEIGIVE